MDITMYAKENQYLIFTGKEVGTFNLWKALVESNGDDATEYNLFDMGNVCATQELPTTPTDIRVSNGHINGANVLLVVAETRLTNQQRKQIQQRQDNITKALKEWVQAKGFDCLEVSHLHTRNFSRLEEYLIRKEEKI